MSFKHFNIQTSSFIFTLLCQTVSSSNSWEFYFTNLSIPVEVRDKVPRDIVVESFPAVTCGDCPSPLNLEILLKPFRRQKCLVVVDNYVNIDVVFEDIPLISRFPRPSKFEFNLKRNLETSKRLREIMWSPHDVNLEKYVNGAVNYGCFRSKYMSPLVYFDGSQLLYCLLLQLEKFSSNTRPWNCQVQIEAFVPLDYLLHTDHLTIFDRLYPFSSQNTAVTINMIVGLPRVLGTRSIGRILYWMKSRSSYNGDSLKLERLEASIFLEVNIHTTKTEIPTYRIKYFRIFRVKNLLRYFEIPFQVWSRVSSEQLVAYVFSNQSIELGWGESSIIMRAGRTVHGILSSVRRCDNLYSKESKSFVNAWSQIQNETHRFEEAVAHILLSIMQNYTLYFPGFYICQGFSKRVVNSADLQHEHLSWKFNRVIKSTTDASSMLQFNNSLENLRFVTCGERGSEPFLLHDLLSAYQYVTWVFIAGFVFVVSKCLSLIAKRDSTLSCLMSLTKILLEQGDPFRSGFPSQLPFRLIICGALLAGIVISNGYKNTNVYNIITDRNRLPFQSFADLQRYNFNIYSKVDMVKYDILDHGKLPSIYESGNTSLFTRVRYHRGLKHYFSLVVGEAFMISVSDWLSTFHDHINLTDKTTLWTSTTLHPEIKEIMLKPLYDLVNTVRGSVSVTYHGEKIKLDTMKSWFFKEEEKVLMKTLAACSKSAIVMNELDCQKYKETLYRQENVNLDVGTEVYSQFPIGVDFVGYVDLPFVRRLWGMQQSGIGDWLTNLVGKLRETGYEKGKVKPAKISGNILVIFLLFITGVVLGCLAFVLEIRKFLLLCILSLITKCIDALKSISLLFLNVFCAVDRKKFKRNYNFYCL